MKLPIYARSQLDAQNLDWSGIAPEHRKRFLNPGEAEALVAIARSVSPITMIEIGVNEGRTARLLLDNVPSLREYVGIDVLPGYVTQCPVQRRELPQRPGWMAASDPRFRSIVTARGTLDLTPEDLPTAQVVFIDGDHGRIAVEHDARLARAIVPPGGVIIFHEYHDLGTVDVRDVLDEFAAEGAPIVHVDGTWIAFEKVR